MASSYFSESEAPRDFRVSSTESDSHYTKCMLCYTVKKNFYCVECIRSGNILHSSMPYSDRFAEKQAKLQRLKANRKHVQDRCEMLLVPKNKQAQLETELKTSRDRVELIKLAIEQRRNNIEARKEELKGLVQHNTELAAKLPRYQKRVASLCKHVRNQEIQLQNQMVHYEEKEQALAALRRERMRQLTRYIFPVYITYDTSDSLEDMEFLGVESEGEEAGGGRRPASCRPRLHVLAASLPAAGDLPDARCVSPAGGAETAGGAATGSATSAARAALVALGQLLSLLAWTLDVRLPCALPLLEPSSNLSSPCRRVCACCVCISARAGVSPARAESPHDAYLSRDSDYVRDSEYGVEDRPSPANPLAALMFLHRLLVAANVDDYNVARVNMYMSGSEAAAVQVWAALLPTPPDDAEPEHIEWQTTEMEDIRESPPVLAPTLMTSAAASIASIWRGWTK